MKTSILYVLSFSAWSIAIPTQSERELDTLFARAVGDSCKANEGTGSCQNTANCKGISYPTGLCPKDPADIQCCVTIACKADGGSGYCRSVSNNGCSGGKFHPGTKAPYPCPGDSDIQCCIKGSSPPPPPKGPSWPSCQQTLSCTFDLIQKSSISDRLAYVRYMESHFFSGQLKSGTQFRAIEGVITFFQSKGLGGAGTWVSYVDSGIVEAIQRGGAIALGMSSATGNNPGTEKWADFLHEMQTGSLGSRDAHDPVWSRSEQAATEYGKSRGDSEAQPASTQDLRWFQFTQLFRLIMRNRSVIIHSIQAFFIFTDPPLALAASPFINWLTDVTDIKPTLCGSAVAWDLSALDTPIGDGILTDAKILAEIIPKFYECYKNR